jgi:16S rRNA (cytosine967-C5)-methyltransferase
MGLVHKLVLETIRRQNFLDYLINRVLQPKTVNDVHPSVRAFLRLYAYQTKVLGSNSYEKATSMAKAGRSIFGWRRLADYEEALGMLLGLEPVDTLKDLDDEEKVALQMFQPLWFVKYCFKLLGRHEALWYFASTLTNTPTYIRVNTLRASEERTLEKLANEGVVLERVEKLPCVYRVTGTEQPLSRAQSFKEGLFYVQDKASCLATQVAAPKADMTVLDVCAAPGAKTTHVAQLMENRGTIYSLDYSYRRMEVWRREIQRMSVGIALPLIADACNPFPLHDVKADLIFLDPPCTSTGAFSHAPSAKWRLSKRSIKGMAALQWKMLNNCKEHVREGGNLVYSTCSITVEENEMLIERFLKLNPEFRLVETEPRIGSKGLRGLNDCQRLYPHINECNGFFIAKLEKSG